MNEEKIRILEMVQEGKITADEGVELLKVLEEPDRAQSLDGKSNKRFMRVRVTSEKGMKVNINLPLGLLKIASKLCDMGMAFIPSATRKELESKGIDLTQIDFQEIIYQVEQGISDGKLVDVQVEDEKEGLMNVEVYVD